MRTYSAYQAADGSLHTTEDQAIAQDTDLLGAELDGLLKLFELDIARNQEYRALMRVLNKREDLRVSIEAIRRILTHADED